WGSGGCGRSRRGRDSGELARILDEFLDRFGFLELNLGDGGNGQQVAETVGNAVRHRSQRRVADLERNGSQVGDSGLELGAQILRLDVENFRREDRARIIHLLDLQTVRERRDVQHVEQRGLGSADLVARLQDGHIVDDFNRTLGNLGRDGQGPE
uniref:Uncharacterized protein n=1 Tax=Anopheles christyi TaxID=43041 RepID=A0A182KIT0_9DIPT